MKRRWIVLVAVLLLGAVSTAWAMPGDSPGPRPAGAPVPDIRPLLANLAVPSEVLDRSKPGFNAYRPGQIGVHTVDDFEGPVLNDQVWLKVWDLDEPPEEHGEYFWALSQCRSSPPGVQSLWAIGGGADGSQLPCGAVYPNGAASAAVMRLDLTNFEDPTVLELRLDFWLDTRPVEQDGVAPDGLFVIFLYDNPDLGRTEWVVLDPAVTSEFPARFWDEPLRYDLLRAKELYAPYREFNLYERGTVDLMFLFKSKRLPGGELPEGVYIDNVRLESDVPWGGETFTPSVPPPTFTPTATNTATITPTREHTETPSPTPTPEAIRVNLPILLRHHDFYAGPETAEPTTEPTDGPTAEPTEPTAEPTGGPTTEPTDEPTAEPTVEPTATRAPDVEIDIAELDSSGKSGTGALWQVGANVAVLLALAPADMADDHPAGIYDGAACDSIGELQHALSNVAAGHSQTDLADTELANVANGENMIAVQASVDDPTFIACGLLPVYSPVPASRRSGWALIGALRPRPQ